MDYERPPVLEGRTIKFPTPCGSLYLTINEDKSKVREVRMRLGKVGYCQRLLLETIAILLSVILQSDIPRQKIIKALSHQMESGCGMGKIWYKGEYYNSCMDYAVEKILEEIALRENEEI